jgi:maleamate amidohydrolase
VDDVYRLQGFGVRLPISGRIGLLLVDFVNGFADPEMFGGGGIADAIAATVPVLAEARRRRWPIAYTRIVFADDGSDANVFSAKVPGLLRLIENDPASAIVPELAPRDGEPVVRKTNPSAFSGTSLQAWLVQHHVRTLAVAGCTTSGCIRASVVDAMSLGFLPMVLSDCVGDRALAPHEANLFDMEQKYANVLASAEVLAAVPAG